METSGGPVMTLRVLDLTDELAFQGSRLLVGVGADVVRPVGVSTKASTAAELHWHSGKRYVRVGEGGPELDQLAGEADVVLESGPRAKLRGVEFDRDKPMSRWPHLAHIVVTPFGLTGPWRDRTADDLVISAAGGMAWLCGRRDGPPKSPPRDQAVQLAGTHAAIAALLAVLAADRDGVGQLVDISAQEAVAATLETGAVAWIHARRYPSRNGGVYEHVAHRIFPTADGYVAGGYSGTDRMWSDLLGWLDDSGEAEDLTDPAWSDAGYRWAGRAHIDEVVSRFTQRRTDREIADEARRRALPWAKVAAPTDLLTNPQLRARDFFTIIETEANVLTGLGFPFAANLRPRPVRLRTAEFAYTAQPWRPAARHKRANAWIGSTTTGEPALAGLRVLDLTWVLAGPYATKILAEHGADVIKVESRHRQDPTRLAPAMRLRPGAGPDDSGYFLNFNHDKRSVAVNMRTAAGQDLARRLAARCHVVVENFSPGTLARWGMSYEELAELNPDVIVVSMAGTGQTGPWRDAVTFADTLAAMSGLSFETRDPGGPPQGLTFGLGDMIAANAAVLGLLDLLIGGRGGHVDLSQLEAMAACMGTAVLEAQLGRDLTGTTAAPPARHPHRVPHGTYPTHGDDRWIAISVEDDDTWRTLVHLTALTELERLRDATPAERSAHEEWIDSTLADWTKDFDGWQLADQLQHAGIAAAVVSNGADLVESDPQLRYRHFYRALAHPIAGTILHEGPVIHLQRTPPRVQRAAPLLGEHTGEVLSELLGMSEREVTSLRETGVLT
jgi:crotonobetainyl-CoA:carnitine CoA-transferase CaiB-like acyl-CoA transferase